MHVCHKIPKFQMYLTFCANTWFSSYYVHQAQCTLAFCLLTDTNLSPSHHLMCLNKDLKELTTITPQPFYGPFSWTTRVSRCQKNFWTLWCKGRLTEADTLTIRLGATPSGLTSAYLHHPPPVFFYRPVPFLLPNQQHQSIEGNF